jgi:hypothetical protein
VAVGEGVEENIPPPDRPCVELWCEGAGLGAGVVSAASFSGRCREAGGEKGGRVVGRRRIPRPLVADGGERSPGLLVKISKFFYLRLEVLDRSRIPRPLHTLAECQGSVLLDVHCAGAASGGGVDRGRGGGGIVDVRARHRTLAHAVLAASCAAGKVLPI